MSELIIVRGLSGSGKSTWTLDYIKNNPGTVRVNRDKIRELYFGSEEDYGVNEPLVTRAQNNLIYCALGAGLDVVVDNTHIEWEYVEATAQLAYSRKATVRIVEIECTLEEALARNARRAILGGRMVPTEVIEAQHERYQLSKGREL